MARRILLLCDVLSPVLYAVADAFAGLRWEGYSFRDQTISELGAIGAPSRPLFSALLIPVYLCLLLVLLTTVVIRPYVPNGELTEIPSDLAACTYVAPRISLLGPQ